MIEVLSYITNPLLLIVIIVVLVYYWWSQRPYVAIGHLIKEKVADMLADKGCLVDGDKVIAPGNVDGLGRRFPLMEAVKQVVNQMFCQQQVAPVEQPTAFGAPMGASAKPCEPPPPIETRTPKNDCGSSSPSLSYSPNL